MANPSVFATFDFEPRRVVLDYSNKGASDSARERRRGDEHMAVDGIWTGEIYGPFGWENRGVFVMENGRILGGDNRQYTAGTYELSGHEFAAELSIHYYGPPRAVFGESREQFDSRIVGTLKDGVIEGTVGRPDRPQFDLQIRLSKRMELPHGR